ncbi:unnamed protein product [Miscanthus lutarioriparius]|uniref:TauD/TfdA-like domain-containing protein n=1 Tax=Miscanthus lutarioriparius TaxID=422564 RepID=A0A811R838_9POAL|nr:unnamed protein product [Miscanthus lutarioriparius]
MHRAQPPNSTTRWSRNQGATSRTRASRSSGSSTALSSPRKRTAADFDRAVNAFGYEELPYVGAAPRTNVVGRVFTANESPPDQSIPFHHKMAQAPTFPSKLFFFWEVEAKSGGETPIVLSHYVYQKVKDKFPEFVEKLEKCGLIYTRVLGEGDDSSSPIGRGWQSVFATSDKVVAEERSLHG